MSSGMVLQNLLSPPVLFFVLGMAAVLLRSDLEIPAPLPKLFSLYLLLAIGFKGGVELQHSGITQQVQAALENIAPEHRVWITPSADYLFF